MPRKSEKPEKAEEPPALRVLVGLPPKLNKEGEEQPVPMPLRTVPPVSLVYGDIHIVLSYSAAHGLGCALLEAAHEAVTQAQMADFFLNVAMEKPAGVRRLLEMFAHHRYLEASQAAEARGEAPEASYVSTPVTKKAPNISDLAPDLAPKEEGKDGD